MGQPIPHHQLDTDFAARGTAAQQLPGALRITARKVPEIIALFWMAKLLTTALGESTSDYLVFHFFNKYLAVGLGALGFVVALLLQLSVRRYSAWVYWLAVLLVAIFGTMAADVVHIQFNVSYLESTVFFACCLAVIFVAWYATEKTLSIHSIYTLRRELFYWATVVTTFALGTAAGDLTASTFNLGYFASALLFIGLIALPALGYWLLRLNAIAAFWFAYIFTRPIGASFADWFGKPILGGLGLGDGPVSLVLFLSFIGVVGYLAATHMDVAGSTPQVRR
jgi:uncharacterized membrane-anchored protein